MRIRTYFLAGALLLAAAVLGTGCEDSAVLPPAEATMLLSASAPVVGTGGTTATATVSAQILAVDSQPAQNVTVTFSTDGGSVAPAARDTDAGGVSTSALTLTETNPDSVVVTARAGSLVQTVSVNNPVGFPDAEAVIAVDQDSPASLLTDLPIFFRSESSDPDEANLPITCVRWRVISAGPLFTAYRRLDQGFELSSADFGLDSSDNEQELQVQLAVTEAPSGALTCDATTRFSDSVDFLDGYYVCRNTPPTAMIAEGSSATATLPGGGGSVLVNLSGSPSTGGETIIGEYRWNCNNGKPDLLGQDVKCGYTIPGIYTVKLTVTDLGAGNLNCALTDEATITVNVNPAP